MFIIAPLKVYYTNFYDDSVSGSLAKKVSTINSHLATKDLSSLISTDTTYFTASVLTLKRSGNVCVLVFSLQVKESFSANASLTIVNFADDTYFPAGIVGVGIHVNSSTQYKGYLRVFASGTNLLKTSSNSSAAVAGDYIQGQITYVI